MECEFCWFVLLLACVLGFLKIIHLDRDPDALELCLRCAMTDHDNDKVIAQMVLKNDIPTHFSFGGLIYCAVAVR